MWKIEHKCYFSQPEPSEYGVLKMERDGKQVTRVVCVNPECKEEFFILGHEIFNESINSNEVNPNLPPGFVVVRSRSN